MTDQLTLQTTPADGGAPRAFTGWTSVRVTRGIDRCPSDFQITATDRNPLQPFEMQIYPGDACKVLLGNDNVLTGYVDRVIPSIDGRTHSLTILGRSKCEDIVDCSAVFQTFQLANVTVLQLAQKLSEPFGITVSAEGDIGGTLVPTFNVALTETPFEVIEEACRYAGLLAFDGRDGNLILSRAGSGQMASGFTQGQNVQGATGLFTLDQRYSEVRAIQVSNQFLFQPVSDPQANLSNNTLASATDPGVKRYRPLLVVAEQNDLNYQVAQRRAQWEVNRRWGRSQQVKVICDSWRDLSGSLWQLNALANVNIPALKLIDQQWLIAEVSFIRDQNGTRSEVTLMPKEAFDVQPIVLPYDARIAEALNYGAQPGSTGNEISVTPLPPIGGAQK